MKRLSVEGVYEFGVLTVLFLIVIHAPISVIFGSLLPQYAEVIKAWKEIVMFVLALLVVAVVVRRHLLGRLIRSRVILVSVAFICVHLLIAAISFRDPLVTAAGLMIDLRFIAMLILVYILVTIRPDVMRRILLSIGAGGVIVVGFGILQVTILPDDVLSGIGYSRDTIAPYVTIDSNQEFVRINSTLRGPNPLGALMVVYAALLIAYIMKHRNAEVRKKYAALAALAGSVAVLIASFSRSAYAAMLLAVVILVAVTTRITRRTIVVGAGCLIASVVGLTVVSSTDWYSNVILHEDPESTVVEKSNDAHVDSLIDGALRVSSQPFGAGIGSTGSATLYDDSPANDLVIENYYFFVAHEAGWIGLLLFVALLGLIFRSLWKRKDDWLSAGVLASGAGLAFASILLPVWADETVAIIWWSLVGAVLASTRGIMKGSHATAARHEKATGTS